MRHFDDLFCHARQPTVSRAIVVEPILGEGGFVVPPMNFFRELRARADRYGILLIVDEVQTGIGGRVRMFAIEHFGIEPDLMTGCQIDCGRAPVSAVVGARDIINALPEVPRRYVMSATPLRVRGAGGAPNHGRRAPGRARRFPRERMRTRFRRWQAQSALVGDVRGLGRWWRSSWCAIAPPRSPPFAKPPRSFTAL